LCVYDLFKMTSHTLGQKFIAPVKPERGVFPLDHEGRLQSVFFVCGGKRSCKYLGECKETMLKYMLCLSRNDGKPGKCQSESKDYFQCRMDR
jgi:hypothetical protein